MRSGILLAHLLLSVLRSGKSARIIAVSSSVHSRIKMVDLTSVVTGAPLTPDSYETSKLLNILFVKELARRLQGTQMTANAADPGFVRTNLGRYATTPVYLATSADVTSSSGGYYLDRHPRELTGLATDAKLARRLWAVSAQALVSRGLATLNEVIAFGA